MAQKKIKAPDILSLLSDKHANDVFVAECKDGPTWGGTHGRMDAWALKKSWANPHVWAYEIKVSRADFQSDLRKDKWQGYLPFCNSFFFVCPSGMVKPEEVPAPAGLMWVAKTGTRILSKKRADFRDVQVPESLYRYLLMSRVKIKDKANGWEPEPAVEYWKRWLEEKQENRRIGHFVSKSLRQILDGEIAETNQRSTRLENEIARLSDLKALLVRMKLYPLNKWAEAATNFRHMCENPSGMGQNAVTTEKRSIKELEDIRERLESAFNPEGENDADV